MDQALVILLLGTLGLYALRRILTRRRAARAQQGEAAARVRADRSLSAEALEAVIGGLEQRRGAPRPLEARPGWALTFRSPYERTAARSWIGGDPHLPESLDWPRQKGLPLNFLMQLDMVALHREASTGLTPPGFPRDGGMAVFLGAEGCVFCRWEAGTLLQPRPAPKDTPDLAERGFWRAAPAFPYRPLTIHTYLDTDGGRPGALPRPDQTPLAWLSTWGLAATEAAGLCRALERALAEAGRFDSWYATRDPDSLPEATQREAGYHLQILHEVPGMLAEAQVFLAHAAAQPATGFTDAAALGAIFAARRDLAAALPDHPAAAVELAGVLHGSPERVLRGLLESLPALRDGGSDLPPACRPLIDQAFRDWRGHRLFGLRPLPAGDLPEDHAPILTLTADPLLDLTLTEGTTLTLWADPQAPEHGRLVRM